MNTPLHSSASMLDLPGFRFHPTEEELLSFYLRSVVLGKKLRGDVIGFLNIYNHDPRELPGLSRTGTAREWYFYVPRHRRKHGGPARPTRTTRTGYWKATGSDRKVLTMSDPKKMTTLGLKKTLVFYEGRAPCGRKTDWIMNEYRLLDTNVTDDVVLCKVYRKATSLKALEQMASMEEDVNDTCRPSPELVSFRDGSNGSEFAVMDCNRESTSSRILDSLTTFLPTC